MDMKDLTYVVTIAQEGSISRAAEKLFMAQSSLSQALQLYEAELGVPLFVRTARGVRPTAAGKAFLLRAQQILMQYHHAQNEIWDIEGLHSGQIELGISTYRGTYLLPSVLREFYRRYPRVHVEITELDSLDLEDRILNGLLDIALIAAPPVRLKQDVEPLMRDEILIVACKEHPVMEFARPNPEDEKQLWVNFEDTASFEYILGPSDAILGRIARREFRRIGREPVGLNTHITASFAASMARAGLGLTLTYRSCIVQDETSRYLRIGREGIFLDLALAYPSEGYRFKAAQELGALFHEIYGNQEWAR